MSDAFTRAVDRLFEDRSLSQAAVYRPVGGGASARVRVILRRPDAGASLFDGDILSSTGTLQVRVAEVASPAKGDSLEVEGVTYKVAATPQRPDPRGLIWALDAPPDESG